MSDGTKLLALAVFLGSIGAYAVWNTVANSGENVEAAPRDELQSLPPDWGAVWVGAPSGADPLPVPEREGFVTLLPQSQEAEGDRFEPDTSGGVFELRVQPGQVLSKICALRYGSSRLELVRRLAAYNGLANPDALKVGQLLRLPPEDVLFAE